MRLQYYLIISFTGLMALILLTINLIMYSMSSGYRRHNFFLSLENSSAIVASATLREDKAKDYYTVKNSILQHLVDEKEYILRIKKDQTNIKFPDTLPLDESFYREAIQNGRAVQYKDGIHYVALFRQDTETEDDVLVVSSAKDVYGDQYRRKLKGTLALTFLVAIVLMTITSMAFSKKLFGQMVKIIKKVNSINAFNLNDRLEKEHSLEEIGELQDTLNDMLHRIETAFKAQQNYVSNTSHSLRTPLTIIAGEAEIALTQIERGHKAEYSLQVISQETEKLKYIINTLLELVKVGSSTMKQSWEITRLDEVIHSVRHSLIKMDPRFKLKVDFNDLPENASMLCIRGNNALLNLAISNIVLNGFKYSRYEEVSIKLTAKGNTANIKVADSGIGIPAEELDMVFNPYFRASNTKDYEGFGIGLPLSLDVIRMHNGSIEVTSEEGIGTVVEISLPTVYSE